MFSFIHTHSRPELGALTDAYRELIAAGDEADAAEKDYRETLRDRTEGYSKPIADVKAEPVVVTAICRAAAAQARLKQSVLTCVVAAGACQQALRHFQCGWHDWEVTSAKINIICTEKVLDWALHLAFVSFCAEVDSDVVDAEYEGISLRSFMRSAVNQSPSLQLEVQASRLKWHVQVRSSEDRRDRPPLVSMEIPVRLTEDE